MIQIEEEKFKRAMRELEDIRLGMILCASRTKDLVHLSNYNTTERSIDKIISLLKNNEPDKNTSN